MKLIKNLIIFLIAINIVSCDFDYDFNSSQESGEDEVVSRYDWDEETDTKSYYENDKLIWKEVYDYNTDGKVIYVKHQLPNGTPIWSHIYEWSDSKVVSQFYYSLDKDLEWVKKFIYNTNNLLELEEEFNKNLKLDNVKKYSYNNTGDIIKTEIYTGETPDISNIYTHDFDFSRNRTKSASYNKSGIVDGYIIYSYNDNKKITMKAGYGNNSVGTTYISTPSTFSFPTTEGVNKTSRNNNKLTPPVLSAIDQTLLQFPALKEDTLDFNWESRWLYDDYGYTQVIVNNNKFPTYIKRDAPVYFNNIPLEIELDYQDSMLISKTTTHGNNELLNLKAEYNSDKKLTKLSTSGEVLLAPLNYNFTYKDSGFVNSIEIESNSNVIQKFTYEYSGDNINKIVHHDGDGNLIGNYTFEYNDLSVEIKVLDASGNYNGKFVLALDSENLLTSITSYSDKDAEVWKYKYTYDELENRVSEEYIKSDLPQIIDSFPIETLFYNLKFY
ncbi:MAG: hypothetical protein JXR64_13025 [Spirochaetales bacterium]|nr:hypothetical protein [Spirochaetales bacterium]